MKPQLFVESIANAEARLSLVVREVQADDPLAPVTVIVPSTYASLHLRRSLGNGRLANVRFMVLPRLAELLGAPALAALRHRSLKPVLEMGAVRSVATMAQGPLEPVKDHPAFHDSLRRAFREMRHATEEALASLERRSELRSEIVRLYREYRLKTAQHYDREDLAESAAQAAEDAKPQALRVLGDLVFYLPRDLSFGETALMEGVARRWPANAVLGLTGDSNADTDVLSIAERLKPMLGEPQEPMPPAPSARTRLMVAPSVNEELHQAARAIVQGAMEGVPLRRMAILYRMEDPYASAAEGRLRQAGIRTTGPSAPPLARSAAGRTLAGLMGLASSDLSRDDVMTWLTSCPIKLSGNPSQQWPTSQWDLASRNAGVVRGLRQWRERLASYADALEQPRYDDDGGVLQEPSPGRLWLAKSARDLAAFVGKLAEDLRLPPENAGWDRFVDWAVDLLDRYFNENGLGDNQEVELRDLAALKEGLAGLNELGVFSDRATMTEFRQAVGELLMAPSSYRGHWGEGVYLGPVGSVLGLRFDRVFVVGMAEGQFPPRFSDNPFLPEQERQEVGGARAGLPVHSDRMARERYDYLAALASAGHGTLSFADANEQARRRQHPSRWLMETAASLNNGERVSSTDLGRLADRPWLTTIASAEAGLRQVHRSSPADPHDYDLHRLLLWRRSGKGLAEHHLVKADKRLARALDLTQARRSSQLTPWDGDVSSLKEAAKLRLTDVPVLSPTALERWATCPFHYLLANVLRVEALEEPEEVTEISPLERGSLVHTILERFMKPELANSRAPAPGQGWSLEQAAALKGIAQEEFGKAESRGVTGQPMHWQVAQQSILADLRSFLERDAEVRGRFTVQTSQVELGFGGKNEVQVSRTVTGVGDLAFRGKIDRLDVSPDGSRALVLDYKTGSADSYRGLNKDPVDRGKRLQLAIYGLAARSLVGADPTVSAAYWFVTSKGGFDMRPGTPGSLEKSEAALDGALPVIAGGIQSGLFPANPGGVSDHNNCAHCDFNRLCPSQRQAQWERKQADHRLAAYVGLSSGGTNDEEGEDA